MRAIVTTDGARPCNMLEIQFCPSPRDEAIFFTVTPLCLQVLVMFCAMCTTSYSFITLSIGQSSKHTRKAQQLRSCSTLRPSLAAILAMSTADIFSACARLSVSSGNPHALNSSGTVIPHSVHAFAIFRAMPPRYISSGAQARPSK